MGDWTPGPWEFKQWSVASPPDIVTAAPERNGHTICIFFGECTEEMMANARLIASAPSLAEEVERLRTEHMQMRVDRDVHKASLATFKAENARLRETLERIADDDPFSVEPTPSHSAQQAQAAAIAALGDKSNG